uniref:TetR/AcrR family transcriptional regulator n=1 Tax=Marinobacterium profundum TaxID=1714300 RepID=UPI00083390C0|nr:TetR/AcrR family transcriptional regulator [Marinobacterium profundum]
MARPVEFVRAEVISSAMNVFWHFGYGATSINTLVKATKLKPGSLYGAFHSKRTLFLEIIDTYAGNRLAGIEAELVAAATPMSAIEALFSRLRLELIADTDGRGCLMVNTLLELGSQDDEMRQRISAHLNRIEQHLATTLQRAIDSGELHTDTSAAILSQFLMNGIWGLRVMSKKRPEPSVYDGIIHQLLLALNPARTAPDLASTPATAHTDSLHA